MDHRDTLIQQPLTENGQLRNQVKVLIQAAERRVMHQELRHRQTSDSEASAWRAMFDAAPGLDSDRDAAVARIEELLAENAALRAAADQAEAARERAMRTGEATAEALGKALTENVALRAGAEKAATELHKVETVARWNAQAFDRESASLRARFAALEAAPGDAWRPVADELAMAAQVQYDAFGAHKGLIDALARWWRFADAHPLPTPPESAP